MSVIMQLDGERVEIADYDGLLAFISTERAHWGWIGNGNIGALQGHVQGQLNDLNNVVHNHRQQGQPLHVPAGAVEQRFSGQLLYSGSPQGMRVLDVRAALGDAAGDAAYGLARGLIGFQELRQLEHIRGMIAYAFPAIAPADALMKDLAAERTKLRRTITEINNRAEAAARDRERSAHLAWWSAARRFTRAQAGMAKAFEATEQRQKSRFADFDQVFADAVESFMATEATYKAQMELQAPVAYWEAKANEHKRREGILKWWVTGYFVVALAALIAMFIYVGGWLLGIPAGGGKIDSAMYVVVGAGLAAITTMMLWAGRLLTRFYLSQNHLHHDANDRAVMTRTYLALTSVRAADEKDRAIILAALFRPSADGIVKDDGAPDLGVAGVASKILTGGKN